MLLREAEIRYTGRRVEGSAAIRSSEDVYRICRDLENETQEHFCVLHVNLKHHVVSRQTVGIGPAGYVSVHPREVFRAAVMAGAHAVILVHNHPSGDCGPSQDDLELTRRLAKCGDLLGIKVLDHVIIGDGSCASLLDRGQMTA